MHEPSDNSHKTRHMHSTRMRRATTFSFHNKRKSDFDTIKVRVVFIHGFVFKFQKMFSVLPLTCDVFFVYIKAEHDRAKRRSRMEDEERKAREEKKQTLQKLGFKQGV